MSNKQRNVFITGGTGSVGIALITAFCNNNDKVTFQYFSQMDIAKDLEEKYGAKGIKIEFTQNDQKLPNTDFHIVVNNAGINISRDLSHEVTIEDWQKTLNVNLFYPFIIIKEYLPTMIKKKWGRIINISSIWGLRGSENNLPYTVSKHGMSGLTKTIAKEYAQSGITCNEICPGAIDSELIKRIASDNQKLTGQSIDEYLKEVCEEIPAGRMANPIEIADLAVFLSTEKAAYLNGASIQIDGSLIC